MRRSARLLTIVTVLALAATLGAAPAAARRRGAAIPDEGPLRPDLRLLTNQATELRLAIRRAADAEQRRRLAGELEVVLHRLGPVDADGKPVQPQAMWHAERIAALRAEVARLAGEDGAAARAKVAWRTLAAACLEHAWRLPRDTALKYQVDAFGQALANSDRLLDEMAGAMATLRGALDRLEGDARARAETALAAAEAGAAAMAEAAEAFEASPPVTSAAAVDAFGRFREGLQAVRDLAVAPDEGEAGPDEATAAKAPAMTEAEKAALAEIRAVAASLDSEEWRPVRTRLERYARAIEGGFGVPSARARAREFLQHLRRAADLARSLAASKAVYPAYLNGRLQALADALNRMESPLRRGRGFSDLGRVWAGDAFRRRLETAGLTPGGASGLLYCQEKVYPELRRSGAEATQKRAAALGRACAAIEGAARRAADGFPRDMSPRLQAAGRRLVVEFRRAASDAGAMFPSNEGTGVEAVFTAADRARDLDRLVRADRAVKKVAAYLPPRSRAMHDQMAALLEQLADPGKIGPARDQLNRLLHPFDGLVDFPAIEPRLVRAATRLAGRAFSAAKAVLGRDIAKGIDDASRGDPTLLNQALEARWLFGLLRTRALAEVEGLPEAGVARLDSLSLPEKAWEGYLGRLDAALKSRIALYAAKGRQGYDWMRAPDAWDAVYRTVAAAQRETLDGRIEGETEADRLLRVLGRAGVEDPHWTRWNPWAVGYHMAELMETTAAGIGQAADYHRGKVAGYGHHLRREHRLAADE